MKLISRRTYWSIVYTEGAASHRLYEAKNLYNTREQARIKCREMSVLYKDFDKVFFTPIKVKVATLDQICAC